MKKSLKVLSSALLLGLSVTGVVTLSSCTDKEAQQAEFSKAREEAVLEYAKESASSNLDAYVAKTLEVLGYQKADVSGLEAKVTEVKGNISAATTKADVESQLTAGINSVYQLIKTKVTENNTSIANQISTLNTEKAALREQVASLQAQLAAEEDSKAYLVAAIKDVNIACNNFYPNTKDDGRVAGILNKAINDVVVAESNEDIDEA